MNAQPTSQSEKTKFLLSNLLKGLIWLVVIVAGYFFAKKYYDFELELLLGPLYEKPVAIFAIFLTSEIVFGIIPPELFMLWSLRDEVLILYIQNIAALALMSYFSGILGYFIGSYFNSTLIYRFIRRNYLGKYEKMFNNYGGFLILVAALTPIPFSGICMLVGAVNYSKRKFFWISMSRFIRFIVYAFIIWEANILN
ncbi:MAG: YqaA family protein [Cyclobacteriaceae bacterium]